jgi:hypothetical protein
VVTEPLWSLNALPKEAFATTVVGAERPGPEAGRATTMCYLRSSRSEQGSRRRPDRCWRIMGRTALVMRITPNRLTSKIDLACSSEDSSAGTDKSDSRVVDEKIDAAFACTSRTTVPTAWSLVTSHATRARIDTQAQQRGQQRQRDLRRIEPSEVGHLWTRVAH